MENWTPEKSATDKTCCAPSCCDGDATTPQAEDTSARDAVRETVKVRYGQAVKAVLAGSAPSCCGSSAASGVGGTDPITRGLLSSPTASSTCRATRTRSGRPRSSRPTSLPA